MRAIIISLILMAFVVVGGAGFWMFKFVSEPALSEDKKEVVLVERETFRAVASRLQQKGLIKNELMFRIYARLTGDDEKIKVGEYELSTAMTPYQVLTVLKSGKSRGYTITISEGLNIFEISELVDGKGQITKSDFLKEIRNSDKAKKLTGENVETLEGFLFPETYVVTRFTTVSELVQKMVSLFNENYSAVLAESNQLKMSKKDHVILASIIEKETGAPEERPLISSVFHNRMKLGMLLQTDPTVIYGIMEKTGVRPQNITRESLRTPTRYNTYTQKGLPFGPIANPGRESLKAALNPTESEFLYFVSKNDGTHIFSKNYAGHKDAVKEYQLNRKQREGKSWRDLNKKAN